MIKFFLSFLSLIISSSAFAIFCPNNFNSINLGDSLDQVLQTCGNPTSRNDFQKNASLPQEWIYYFRTNPLDTSNSKLNIVFNTNNQVINIEITNGGILNKMCDPFVQVVTNGAVNVPCQSVQMPKNVNSTNVCGAYIKLGDDKRTVESTCGKPAFINQSQGQINERATEITELYYENSTPPITLYFENGRLANRLY